MIHHAPLQRLKHWLSYMIMHKILCVLYSLIKAPATQMQAGSIQVQLQVEIFNLAYNCRASA